MLRVIPGPIFIAATLCLALSGSARAHDQCATIPDGTIYGDRGEQLTVGFDEWGYNYRAHFFFGLYCDAQHDAEWCQPYRDVRLVMNWNDAWLSNRDCDGDGKLDRHFGFDSYLGSGAYLTNLMHGSYEHQGRECPWIYFAKFEAAPVDGSIADGVWYDADGEELGPVTWEEFAMTKEKLIDPCGQARALGMPH
jgi:hypothetical protein